MKTPSEKVIKFYRHNSPYVYKEKLLFTSKLDPSEYNNPEYQGHPIKATYDHYISQKIIVQYVVIVSQYSRHYYVS